MPVEVLLSCMNQKDLSILKSRKIKSDTVIINQSNKNEYYETFINDKRIRVFTTTQRGLSKSRNYALNNAIGDICVLCDDDVTYEEDYEYTILKAFSELKKADIIVFNTKKMNSNGKRKLIKSIKRAPFYKSYGSVRIAFRLKSIQKSNVWFNVNFGSGSIYGSGEESIWLNEARKKGLKVYEYPATIATVDYSDSTWFKGYNEKFFYDKGVYLAEAHPYLKYIYIFYFYLKLRKKTKLTSYDITQWVFRGAKSKNKVLSYENYKNLYLKKVDENS